jgi:hypothetical protein
MHILIFAPSPTDGHALRGMVAPLCREVVCAHNFAEVEKFCRTQRFDAIVSVGFGWHRMGRKLHNSTHRGGVVVLGRGRGAGDVLSVIEGAHLQYLSLPVNPRRLRAKLCKLRGQ